MSEPVVLDILDHLRNWARAETGVERWDRAERASERATPRCLDNALHKKSSGEQVITRRRNPFKRESLAHVTLLKPSISGIREELGPDGFSLANDDTIEIFQCLIRREGRMWPASYDTLTTSFEFTRQTIGLGSKPTEEGERYQVCLSFEIDWFNLLMDDPNRILKGSNRSKVDPGDRWHEMSFVPESIALHVYDDDIDSHWKPASRYRRM